jgi:hypothetical protein
MMNFSEAKAAIERARARGLSDDEIVREVAAELDIKNSMLLVVIASLVAAKDDDTIDWLKEVGETE